MASHRPSLRLVAPSLLLALALVSGSAVPAIARDARPASNGVQGGSAPAVAGSRGTATPLRQDPDRALWRLHELANTTDIAATSVAEFRPATPDVPVARPVAVSKVTPAATTGSTDTGTPAFRGRNHVWIPSLGINRSISFFSCSSKAYPGNRVYRWGCAGSNNVYLFGHAHSVFKPLNEAYVSGRLRKGMAVFYAGNDGVVHRFTVRWWKVTTPEKGAWAYASQGTPSLTLQTCVGARSQFRLVVRLVQSD